MVEIAKPLIDDRSYRLITLDNALDVLLVSDPETDKAAAAMDVHVGHLCDEGVSGLAHFCEHL
jgi:insulysin